MRPNRGQRLNTTAWALRLLRRHPRPQRDARPKRRTAPDLPRRPIPAAAASAGAASCPSPPRRLLPACRCRRQHRPHHPARGASPSSRQLSASALALPKPAGQAGGCRSLPSRCFIRGCAKHRRLKPGQCRRCRQTRAGSEGNARLFSPVRSQSMSIFTPVYVPALVTPKGRLDTQRLQASLDLQANALSHLSLPHPGNRWEMCSPKLRGEESAPAARGRRACRGPALRACTSAGWATAARHARGEKMMIHHCAFIMALVQPLAPAGHSAFFHRVKKR